MPKQCSWHCSVWKGVSFSHAFQRMSVGALNSPRDIARRAPPGTSEKHEKSSCLCGDPDKNLIRFRTTAWFNWKVWAFWKSSCLFHTCKFLFHQSRVLNVKRGSCRTSRVMQKSRTHFLMIPFTKWFVQVTNTLFIFHLLYCMIFHAMDFWCNFQLQTPFQFKKLFAVWFALFNRFIRQMEPLGVHATDLGSHQMFVESQCGHCRLCALLHQ